MSVSVAQLVLTACIGILGFGGVIYTIRENAKLSREERRDERNHLASTLRHALHVELSEIRRMYVERVRELTGASAEDSGALIPTVCPRSIYDGSTSQLRVLTPPEIEKLIHVYALVSELPSRLALLPRSLGDAAMDRDGYVYLPCDQLQFAGRMHEEFLEPIHEAIEEIEQHSKAEVAARA